MSVRDIVESTALVENHCHQVEPRTDLDPETFAGYFTEGPASEHARHTLYYQSGIELLRERFDGETEAELVAARNDADFDAYASELMAEANISHIIQDVGLPRDSDPEAFARYTEAEINPVLRIENVEEELIAAHEGFADFERAFERRIEEALAGEYVGLKSIAAYRTGLDVGAPSRSEAARAYFDLGPDWDGRLEDPVVLDYCVNLAAEIAADHDAPIQFHSGLGDHDAHSQYVDPTYLHEFIGAHPDTPVVLLHTGYPYHRGAAYLTSVMENAHLDLGLAVPFVHHGVENVIREVLELVPTSKLLYSSDGYVIPEWYVLSARRFRSAFASVLEELVEEGFVDEAFATRTASNVMRENALELYGLD